MNRKSFMLALLIAAASVVMAGCKTQPKVAAPPPPEVAVEKPTQRDVTLFQDFTGNADAIESVEIRARVQGFLESFNFEAATLAKKGDLLFVIERAPYMAVKAQAEAEVDAAKEAAKD